MQQGNGQDTIFDFFVGIINLIVDKMFIYFRCINEDVDWSEFGDWVKDCRWWSFGLGPWTLKKKNMGVIYRNCTGISYHFVHGISKCRCEYCGIKRLNSECCEDSGGLAGRSKNLFHQYKVTMWLRNNSAVLLWRADCKEIMHIISFICILLFAKGELPCHSLSQLAVIVARFQQPHSICLPN